MGIGDANSPKTHDVNQSRQSDVVGKPNTSFPEHGSDMYWSSLQSIKEELQQAYHSPLLLLLIPSSTEGRVLHEKLGS